MYTIDNFLEIKDEIYEYCVNLTLNISTRQRQFTKADDLFQDVYLKSYEELPKINKIIVDKANYIQIIKNITFWVCYSRFNQKFAGNKVLNNLHYFSDSTAKNTVFEEIINKNQEENDNIINSPDFKFYTRTLNVEEKQVVKLVILGYNMIEILKKLNIDNNGFYLVFEKLWFASIENPKINNLELIKFKRRVTNLNYYKKIIRNNEIYFLYLNGFTHEYISKQLDIKKSCVTSYICRRKKNIRTI